MRERGDFVCGEVNAREAGSGYRRFVHDRRAGSSVIDPGAGQQLPAGADPAACAKPFAYQTVEERLGCAYGPAEQAAAERQRRFDALWDRACGRD